MSASREGPGLENPGLENPGGENPEQGGARLDELSRQGAASRLGIWLAVTFSICFATGLLSHEYQEPSTWIPWGPSPSWGYRVSQGLHVCSGLLAVPLLLAKLHVVFGQLFAWPPVRGLVHGLERLSVALLVGSAIFMLTTGIMNTTQWYPWGFSFRAAHLAVAWVTVGSLVIHVGVKLPVVRAALDRPVPTERRGFLVGVGAAVAGTALFTVGEAFSPLSDLAVLAPRRPGVGPQGLPVNTTAAQAQVSDQAADQGWRLTLVGPGGDVELDRDALLSMPQRSVDLPIACVEGWSSMARWSGVPVARLVEMVGSIPTDHVRVVSLQRGSRYATSVLPPQFLASDDTLLALRLNGSDLHLDHGFPARIIAPDRPGVLQTKWVARLEVVAGTDDVAAAAAGAAAAAAAGEGGDA
ncbi:MAG: molybdopterin-dependent oxidoreductase [Janthinobacterium lividum]